MDFWRALSILNNRKWLIILSVLVATTLTYGATRLVGAKWQATVKFMSLSGSSLIEPQAKQGSADAQATVVGSVRDRDNAQMAQMDAVIKSKDVIEKALKKMAVAQFPSDILDRIQIASAGPQIYVLMYQDNSPTRAERIANALADSFVDRYQDIRSTQAQNVTDLLEEQVKKQDAKLVELRTKYDKYRERLNILGQAGRNTDAVIGRLDTARSQYADAQNKASSAQAQLAAKETELRGVPKTIKIHGRPIPNPLVGQLKIDLAAADKVLNALRNRYSDDYPSVRKAKTDRDGLEKQLSNELAHPAMNPDEDVPNPRYTDVERNIGALKAEVAGYQAQIPIYQTAVSKAQGEINSLKGTDSAILTMAKEIDQESDIRTGFQARLNMARVALDAAKAQQPLTITDHVSEFNPAVSTSGGRTVKLLLLAILGSLIGTSAIVVAMDSIDRRVKTVGQAELELPARVIAAIPRPMGNISYASLARATELQPSSLHSEAFRFLGLHLLSPRGPRVKSLMVLSAKAEQGSTTTVTNLGITLAQAGKRVIIVDANIRTAELHQVFEMNNDFGFTDLLKKPSDENLNKAMRPTSVNNLWVITSGPRTDNTWELYRSDNLATVSKMLHEKADYVLYDTPSALIFTDAMNLAPVVDAAFLCVRALEPLTGAEKRVVELLEQSNVQILGSVLNDVPAQTVDGYHNYQHYYAQGAVPAIPGRGGASSTVPLIEMSKGDSGKNGKS